MFLNVWLTMSRFIRNMKLLNIIDYRNSFVTIWLSQRLYEGGTELAALVFTEHCKCGCA